MKLFLLIALVIIILSTFIICKPKSVKQKLYGYWHCVQSDADYQSKSFQLALYKNDTFYWYLRGRAPRSAVRGTFTLTDTTKITFQFSDTNEESVFIIKKIEPKLLEVDYNGHTIIFNRIIALKTSAI